MDFKSNSDDGPPPCNIQLTEVMEPHDLRENDFCEAVKKEIEVLIKRKPWKVVCRNEIPEGYNI